ncbi:DUF3021 domain-containing protein [Metabacillus malikii]|uniref:Magnesium-transporting ATPase (P-type) n=1 Tax=Metabacillus malikii TaxID=1504265 RepID=A0ABT9ZGV2_9BACI|nr:DUF3021 domain-containing protein [Metabacillus malikii]MDQ0231519.1 magnesium-transporting ATPase (P-type) [Metabacillus malikii]
MKSFIMRSFIGICFGAIVAVVVTNLLFLVGGLEAIDGDLFLKNSLGSLFCGWFFIVSPMYFEIRKLTLSQQTILHFVTVLVLYFILALTIGWIPFNTNIILLTIFSAIVVYAGIWTAFYLYFKNQARKLNDDLKKC